MLSTPLCTKTITGSLFPILPLNTPLDILTVRTNHMCVIQTVPVQRQTQPEELQHTYAADLHWILFACIPRTFAHQIVRVLALRVPTTTPKTHACWHQRCYYACRFSFTTCYEVFDVVYVYFEFMKLMQLIHVVSKNILFEKNELKKIQFKQKK